MISDLFRSSCWPRKCLVRLPQFREHDYRGLITSPDPVLNRQKITRLCYDFLSPIWGVDFKRSTPARHVFCFVSMFAFAQQFGSQMGNKIQKFDRECLLFFSKFSLKNYGHHLDEVTADHWARSSIFIYAKEGLKNSTQPFTFVDDFPDQTGCDYFDRFIIKCSQGAVNIKSGNWGPFLTVTVKPQQQIPYFV